MVQNEHAAVKNKIDTFLGQVTEERKRQQEMQRQILELTKLNKKIKAE